MHFIFLSVSPNFPVSFIFSSLLVLQLSVLSSTSSIGIRVFFLSIILEIVLCVYMAGLVVLYIHIT